MQAQQLLHCQLISQAQAHAAVLPRCYVFYYALSFTAQSALLVPAAGGGGELKVPTPKTRRSHAVAAAAAAAAVAAAAAAAAAFQS
jgi:hypothetical protein